MFFVLYQSLQFQNPVSSLIFAHVVVSLPERSNTAKLVAFCSPSFMIFCISCFSRLTLKIATSSMVPLKYQALSAQPIKRFLLVSDNTRFVNVLSAPSCSPFIYNFAIDFVVTVNAK